jgi:hypothetical protein
VRQSAPQAVIAGIKAGTNVWHGGAALDVLRSAFKGRRRICAVSIYIALTEFAADQLAPATLLASPEEIGSRAGVAAHITSRYLAEFVRLGLLTVEQAASGKLALTLLDPATSQPREYPEAEPVGLPAILSQPASPQSPPPAISSPTSPADRR